MAIVENADLKLTLIIYADESKDIVALMRDAAKEIKRGSLAGNVGGCIGSYQYEIVEQTRAAEQRDEAVGGITTDKKADTERWDAVCGCTGNWRNDYVGKTCWGCGQTIRIPTISV